MNIAFRVPYFIRLYYFRKKFHKKWKTKVFPNNIFNLSYIKKIGHHSYGPIEVYGWEREEEGLEIGNFVSIANDVTFVLGGNHPMDRLTTYPLALDFSTFPVEHPETKGRIIIENDVWIGMKCIIMSGVKVGQGAVVMAGSVVTKDVPPYAIVGGVPAKIVKYRFQEEIRKELLEKLDWDKITDDLIQTQSELFLLPVSEIIEKGLM